VNDTPEIGSPKKDDIEMTMLQLGDFTAWVDIGVAEDWP